MENPNPTIDFSHVPARQIADTKTGGGAMAKINNQSYFLIIGVSFALACFFYYIFIKNETEQNTPRITPLPAVTNWNSNQ